MNIAGKQSAPGLAAGGPTAGRAEDGAGGSDPTAPRGAGQETYFFRSSSMGFAFLLGLGRAYQQGNKHRQDAEPKAGGLRDLRIFDWLDETLGVT